jgi:PAS domain S-box-containing protein
MYPQQDYRQLYSSMLHAFDALNLNFFVLEVVCDEKGAPVDVVYREVSPSTVRLIGKPRGDIIGKSRRELFGNITDEFPAKFYEVIQTGEPAHFQSQGAGLKKVYDVYAWKVSDKLVAAIVSDISEQTRTGEALKVNNRRMSEILESIQEYFYSLDRKWNFIYVNQKAAKLLGHQPKDLIGKNIWSVFPRALGTAFEENYRAAMEKKEIRRFETRGAHADVWLMVTVFPSEEGISSLAIDITERKKAEGALRESEERLRFSTESAHIGLWDLDLVEHKAIRSPEHSKIFGYKEPTGNWTLNDFLNHMLPEYRQEFQETMQKGITEQRGWNFECKIRRVDGEVRWVWLSGRLYTAPSGHERVAGIIQDITERKTAEMELKKYSESLQVTQKELEEKNAEVQKYAVKMEDLAGHRLKQLKDAERLATIGATAGMVGHDIRNPLQAIVGDLYLAKEELAELPEEKAKNALEYIGEIDQNIDYINKIVQDLQDYARPLNPNPELVDLKQLIEALIAKNAVPQNIEVTVNVADNASKIKTDGYYLNRILYNLITNSVQAMPQGGKLTIETEKTPKYIVLRVKDTGVGIPKDVQQKMFTVMFTTKSKGQGFGLPVVKRMTESLGGKVSFESQEGKGTTFTLKLPIKA